MTVERRHDFTHRVFGTVEDLARSVHEEFDNIAGGVNALESRFVEKETTQGQGPITLYTPGAPYLDQTNAWVGSGTWSAGSVFTPTTPPSWGVNAYRGYYINYGTASYIIERNTATTLTAYDAPTSGTGTGTITTNLPWLQANYPDDDPGTDTILPFIKIRVQLPSGLSIENSITLLIGLWDTTQNRGFTLTQFVQSSDVALGYMDTLWKYSGIKINDSCYVALAALGSSGGYSQTNYGDTERIFTAGVGAATPENPTIVVKHKKPTHRKYYVAITRPFDNVSPYSGYCINYYTDLEIWMSLTGGAGNTHPDDTSAADWEMVESRKLKTHIQRIKSKTTWNGNGSWTQVAGTTWNFTPDTSPAWSVDAYNSGYRLQFMDSTHAGFAADITDTFATYVVVEVPAGAVAPFAANASVEHGTADYLTGKVPRKIQFTIQKKEQEDPTIAVRFKDSFGQYSAWDSDNDTGLSDDVGWIMGPNSAWYPGHVTNNPWSNAATDPGTGCWTNDEDVDGTSGTECSARIRVYFCNTIPASQDGTTVAVANPGNLNCHLKVKQTVPAPPPIRKFGPTEEVDIPSTDTYHDFYFKQKFKHGRTYQIVKASLSSHGEEHVTDLALSFQAAGGAIATIQDPYLFTQASDSTSPDDCCVFFPPISWAGKGSISGSTFTKSLGDAFPGNATDLYLIWKNQLWDITGMSGNTLTIAGSPPTDDLNDFAALTTSSTADDTIRTVKIAKAKQGRTTLPGVAGTSAHLYDTKHLTEDEDLMFEYDGRHPQTTTRPEWFARVIDKYGQKSNWVLHNSSSASVTVPSIDPFYLSIVGTTYTVTALWSNGANWGFDHLQTYMTAAGAAFPAGLPGVDPAWTDPQTDYILDAGTDDSGQASTQHNPGVGGSRWFAAKLWGDAGKGDSAWAYKQYLASAIPTINNFVITDPVWDATVYGYVHNITLSWPGTYTGYCRIYRNTNPTAPWPTGTGGVPAPGDGDWDFVDVLPVSVATSIVFSSKKWYDTGRQLATFYKGSYTAILGDGGSNWGEWSTYHLDAGVYTTEYSVKHPAPDGFTVVGSTVTFQLEWPAKTDNYDRIRSFYWTGSGWGIKGTSDFIVDGATTATGTAGTTGVVHSNWENYSYCFYIIGSDSNGPAYYRKAFAPT